MTYTETDRARAQVSSDPMIRIDGLTKSYGTTRVLDGIDLEVPQGLVFALLGPNGAGKTTLIKILSTLVAPDRGHAQVAGYDVISEAAMVRRSISLTGQYAAVDPLLTGIENLQMLGRLAGLTSTAARARAAELLQQFDLVTAGRRRVGTYSGGMRRRLDLALSLIVVPPVLFLDEPTTGLDTRSRQALWDSIRSLVGQGCTVLLTTQYLEEADQLADRIAVINDGRVVASGTPIELKSAVGAERVELHDHDQRLITEQAIDGSVSEVRSLLERFSAHPNARVTIRKPTMDDVFLTLTTTTQPHPSASDTSPTVPRTNEKAMR